MSLTCLGFKNSFDLYRDEYLTRSLAGGRSEYAKKTLPYANGVFWDNDDATWVKGSLLFGPFNKGRNPLDRKSWFQSDWLGSKHNMKEGSIKFPPTMLDEWTVVGRVQRWWYVRGGVRYPHAYQHPLRRTSFFFIEVVTLLRKHGSWYRMDATHSGEGGGISLNWRGMLYP